MVETKNKKYFEAVGRRKRAIARVRIFEASKQSVEVNEKELEVFFPVNELQRIVTSALELSGAESKFAVTARVRGGGISSQAESIRLGIARALVKYNEELRGVLKEEGFLRRDARIKERKKFGLRKARRAPQWSKR